MNAEAASHGAGEGLSWRSSMERIGLWVGAATYVVSFFLPAVRTGSSGSDTLVGWECARIALSPVWQPQNLTGLLHDCNVLLFASGLINPMALAYLVLRVRGRGLSLRRRIAIVTMAFIVLTWIYLAELHLGIEIGHVVWIAGLLLMMAPGVFLGSREKPVEAHTGGV